MATKIILVKRGGAGKTTFTTASGSIVADVSAFKYIQEQGNENGIATPLDVIKNWDQELSDCTRL